MPVASGQGASFLQLDAKEEKLEALKNQLARRAFALFFGSKSMVFRWFSTVFSEFLDVSQGFRRAFRLCQAEVKQQIARETRETRSSRAEAMERSRELVVGVADHLHSYTV